MYLHVHLLGTDDMCRYAYRRIVFLIVFRSNGLCTDSRETTISMHILMSFSPSPILVFETSEGRWRQERIVQPGGQGRRRRRRKCCISTCTKKIKCKFKWPASAMSGHLNISLWWNWGRRITPPSLCNIDDLMGLPSEITQSSRHSRSPIVCVLRLWVRWPMSALPTRTHCPIWVWFLPLSPCCLFLPPLRELPQISVDEVSRTSSSVYTCCSRSRSELIPLTKTLDT